MVRSFPSPPIQAFQRLQISDGLLMNAELWNRAHGYHRDRQNFLYQALHHPAIVCGLGVTSIHAPSQLSSTYRDDRWIEVQPGIAIDMAGNPIVVAQAQTFHLESEPPTDETLLVYLAINYVDPDELKTVTGDRQTVQEQFRIVEKTSLAPDDVELCRVLLAGEKISITNAPDVFHPQANELNLRHRQAVEVRPVGQLTVSQLTVDLTSDFPTTRKLTSLLKSVDALYPRFQGQTDIQIIPTKIEVTSDPQGQPEPESLNGDLIYAPWTLLKTYIKTNSEQLVEAIENGSILVAIATLADAGLSRSADDEEIKTQVQSLVNQLKPMAEICGAPLADDGVLDAFHPLRTEPFLFAQLPLVDGVPLIALQWGPIILLVGDVAQYWGPDEALQRPREVIRTAQEFGINLLMFAWQHHNLTKLKQRAASDPSKARSTAVSLTSRINPSSS